MKPSQCVRTALVLLLLVLAGCQGAKDQSTGATEKEYEVKGKVVAVDPAKPSVTLDHEDIPGLMKAMKMEFRVEDKQLLEGVQAGDHVQGRLKKAEAGLVITHLKKQ
jgi:protein SCO1/2